MASVCVSLPGYLRVEQREQVADEGREGVHGGMGVCGDKHPVQEPAKAEGNRGSREDMTFQVDVHNLTPKMILTLDYAYYS